MRSNTTQDIFEDAQVLRKDIEARIHQYVKEHTWRDPDALATTAGIMSTLSTVLAARALASACGLLGIAPPDDKIEEWCHRIGQSITRTVQSEMTRVKRDLREIAEKNEP